MKSFFKGLWEWFKKLGKELYVVIEGTCNFVRDEPLASILAVVVFVGICYAGVCPDKTKAAVALMSVTMLYGMFQYKMMGGSKA